MPTKQWKPPLPALLLLALLTGSAHLTADVAALQERDGLPVFRRGAQNGAPAVRAKVQGSEVKFLDPSGTVAAAVPLAGPAARNTLAFSRQGNLVCFSDGANERAYDSRGALLFSKRLDGGSEAFIGPWESCGAMLAEENVGRPDESIGMFKQGSRRDWAVHFSRPADGGPRILGMKELEDGSALVIYAQPPKIVHLDSGLGLLGQRDFDVKKIVQVCLSPDEASLLVFSAGIYSTHGKEHRLTLVRLADLADAWSSVDFGPGIGFAFSNDSDLIVVHDGAKGVISELDLDGNIRSKTYANLGTLSQTVLPRDDRRFWIFAASQAGPLAVEARIGLFDPGSRDLRIDRLGDYRVEEAEDGRLVLSRDGRVFEVTDATGP
jgi:hypothetical protein